MSKNVTIQITGGFHNSATINVRVPLRVWSMVMQGMPVNEAFSAGQYKRLDRHFCGINGCMCGSLMRATATLVSHRVVPI